LFRSRQVHCGMYITLFVSWVALLNPALTRPASQRRTRGDLSNLVTIKAASGAKTQAGYAIIEGAQRRQKEYEPREGDKSDFS
jgi:hypothetical protein